MIYQTDKEFPPAIYHWGCYLLSLCERLTSYFDAPFSHGAILDLVEYGQRKGFIDAQMTLLNPQALCDESVGAHKVLFMGKKVSDYYCSDAEFEIVCYHRDGASFNHFCSGNGKGIVVYDPWGPMGSESVRNGNLIGKRIYRVL